MVEDKRISIDVSHEDYRQLKACVDKLGLSTEQFVFDAVMEKVDCWEDKWMLEQWEKDGTRAEIEADRNDPNRIVYYWEGDVLKEITYSELIKTRKEEVEKLKRKKKEEGHD